MIPDGNTEMQERMKHNRKGNYMGEFELILTVLNKKYIMQGFYYIQN